MTKASRESVDVSGRKEVTVSPYAEGTSNKSCLQRCPVPHLDTMPSSTRRPACWTLLLSFQMITSPALASALATCCKRLCGRKLNEAAIRIYAVVDPADVADRARDYLQFEGVLKAIVFVIGVCTLDQGDRVTEATPEFLDGPDLLVQLFVHQISCYALQSRSQPGQTRILWARAHRQCQIPPPEESKPGSSGAPGRPG